VRRSLKQIDRLADYSDVALLEELRRVSRELHGSSLTIADIETHARCSYALLKKRFGGLREALTAAGLDSPPFHRDVSDDDLLNELERVWDAVLENEGRRPYKGDLRKYGARFSQGPYYRRWGSWIRACEACLDRSDSEQNAEPFMKVPRRANEKKAKRSIPLKLRYDVLKRDGFRCVLCGRSPATTRTVNLHVDHIEPEARGGPTIIGNLRTLCEECNVGRGTGRSAGRP